jgi:hypothetical protein
MVSCTPSTVPTMQILVNDEKRNEKWTGNKKSTAKIYKQMSQQNQKSLDEIIGDASAFKFKQIAPKK